MRESENIAALSALKPDFIGFIFYPPSSRFAGQKLRTESLRILPAGTQKTGVFVNADFEEIMTAAKKFSLDFIQLHGRESPELAGRLSAEGLGIIKVFSVGQSFDFQQIKPYKSSADYFLFDTASKTHGGSGKKFDATILNNYPSEKPFLLAGGLGPEDAENLLKLKLPVSAGFDLNSRFETEPGLKNIPALERFFRTIRAKK